MKRRHFLKMGLMAATATPVASILLSMPGMLYARDMARDTFTLKTAQDVANRLFKGKPAVSSDAVRLEVPIQSDGKSVPVKVKTELDNIKTIAIVTENTDQPLASVVSISGPVSGFSTRVRVEKTSTITAYVSTDDKLYSATASIKISKGGYGMSH
jgi:predicted secreted protein